MTTVQVRLGNKEQIHLFKLDGLLVCFVFCFIATHVCKRTHAHTHTLTHTHTHTHQSHAHACIKHLLFAPNYITLCFTFKSETCTLNDRHVLWTPGSPLKIINSLSLSLCISLSFCSLERDDITLHNERLMNHVERRTLTL